MPNIQVSNDINRILDETNAEMALPIEVINDALDQLSAQPTIPLKRIGFNQDVK